MDIDVRLVTDGLWYDITAAATAAQSGSPRRFLICVLGSRRHPGGIVGDSQRRHRAALIVPDGTSALTSTYDATNGWRVDRALNELYTHRGTNDGFDKAVRELAPGGAQDGEATTAVFDRGFDALIGKRATYDRAKTVSQIRAFDAPHTADQATVGRILVNDPNALRQLAAARAYRLP